MYFLLVIAGLLAAASAKNLTVGVGGGHLVYEQNKTASPAIWKQQEQVTVNVSDAEVITQVVVIDCREDQNGEASILEGGAGSKNVTLLLKSPSILRGYCFEVSVYAQPDDGQVHVVDNNQRVDAVDGQQTVHHEFPEVSTTSTTKLPSIPTQVPDGQQEIQHPVQVSHGQEIQHPVQVSQGQDQVRQSRHTEVHEQKPLIPEVVGQNETQKDLLSQIFDEEEDTTELKTTQGPKTETTELDGQQTKLPLPYVTEKPVQVQKPDSQEVQKVKTL